MTHVRPAAVIVLAAGNGTRMKSALVKTMHAVAGRPLVGHVTAAGQGLGPEQLAVVVGCQADTVTAYLAEAFPEVKAVYQAEQLGTGHATRIALEALESVDGTVIVSTGDTPLLTTDSLQRLADGHAADGNAVTVLTADVADPTGYGRVVRDADGSVTGIVEHKDATAEQRAVTEINSGIFAFDGKLLAEALTQVRADNSQGEEYLTDVLGILRAAGHRVGAALGADHREFLGVNDRVQLAAARRLLNERLVEAAMRAGVTVVDPATALLEVGVTFEPDAVVHPNTQLHGSTHLGAGCEVGPNSTLTDTRVGAGATVSNTTSLGARIGDGATVGPYAYLRPGTVLGAKGKIGTYVETKNADIGAGSKVPHLSYVGDATIGEGTNIGAASVFVNYDGVNKHHTTVGSHCRMGSDNMYVAPITVGDGAYSGAGSVLTKDVPSGSLAVNRGQQRNVEGWVLRKRAGTAAAEAAERAAAAGPVGDAGDESPEDRG
ncbi:UDP-N-acetylglucosamine diphosphorylase/glucosamine-1-phosphate N-acetyltransferase [Mangrovactinospora gilvigrisea]|uniref:Bifunctional protein GlmU n=1 Tax=Mangrovactinospora gilvigrisea TaxID=1428644 RepID=A0A1J7BJV1_9ACTN|nr:bifunctional UDP-N-acetylglucosamine diphosphorylase/glucosamine-1-phosphate N-acetyltransferase GlmU [Mangrovactinospora gilvigrisea]OIV38869.1 UDP-N-acetylglucosamine diphosphorylase/glucosamine-1-phosphate N-acetyltransferase [Mangrovactinospora gilvigrisea]